MELTRNTIYLSLEARLALRQQAAREDSNMSAIVERVLRKELKLPEATAIERSSGRVTATEAIAS